MEPLETRSHIETLIKRQGRMPEDQIAIGFYAQLDRDLGMDSYDKIELILMMETDFNINILDDGFEPEMTFGQLVTKIDAIRFSQFPQTSRRG